MLLFCDYLDLSTKRSKGATGKKGFCRMGFWHWARSRDDKGKAIAKRSHGVALQSRWNGIGDPPLQKNPPHIGAAALETTHPFHFKMTPSMLLGPACNHDLGVLLRMPSSITKSETSEIDIDAAMNSMLDVMGDHEYYCATYSSKDQPHVEGLLMTLATALRAKSQDIVSAKGRGEDVTDHEVSRKLLHTLVAATNRRMHKGFPEMLTYLLQKPMEYCSHEFVSLTITTLMRVTLGSVAAYVSERMIDHVCEQEKPFMRLACKVKLSVWDYQFRPDALLKFPLYFFMSGCEATKRLNGDSMLWKTLQVNKGVAHQRSYSEEPIASTSCPHRTLVDENNSPLHTYGYYVRLRTHSRWKIPLIQGRNPSVPDATAPMSEKVLLYTIHFVRYAG